MAGTDPFRSAHSAGLRYVSDERQGIRRETGSLGFRYVGPDGKVIRKAPTLKRIRALVIPPSWKDVCICTYPRGLQQSSGRDAHGLQTYRSTSRCSTMLYYIMF